MLDEEALITDKLLEEATKSENHQDEAALWIEEDP